MVDGKASHSVSHMGFPKIGRYFFRGPNNKDPIILGSILGVPHFGKLPHILGFRV